MWYLIVPPIIVVVSLLFVLWYLSRKGADPLIAGKALKAEETAGHRAAFSRIRNFFLHVLEKTAYRFKVVSLRIHNELHDLTQSLKARQRHSQSQAPVSGLAGESHDASTRRQAVDRQDDSHNVHVPGKKRGEGEGGAKEESFSAEPAVPIATVLDEPIVRNRKTPSSMGRSTTTVPMSATEAPSVVWRPTVSETATHPEKMRKRTQGDHSREEDLIGRIAVNPKDFTAYEGLGDYYLENGNVKDAKECYRQVLKLSPVQRMVKIKIRRLEKILSQKTDGGTE